MDVQTPLICAGVVAVTSAVVYLSSVFGIRERTYEEAIEEQRKKSGLVITPNTKTNKVDKQKKEKKEKKKEKKEKKEKPKEKQITSSGPVVESTEAKPGLSHARDASVSRKTEHVEFKPEPEVVLLSEDTSAETPIQRKSVSNEKPIKPILTNKTEQMCHQSPLVSPTLNGNGQRNSFDHILPKDELELLKDSKRAADKEPFAQSTVTDGFDVKHLETIETPLMNGVNALESIHSDSTDNEPKPEPNKSDNSHTTSPARRTKRSKQTTIDGRYCHQLLASNCANCNISCRFIADSVVIAKHYLCSNAY